MSVNGNEGKTILDAMVVTSSAEYDMCQYCDIRPTEIFQLSKIVKELSVSTYC